MDNRRIWMRFSALMIGAATLIAGCSTTDGKPPIRISIETSHSHGREFHDITRTVKRPVQVDSFRKKFNQLEMEKLSLTIEHFQGLVEWALVLRHQTIQFALELKRKKAKDQPVTGDDLETMNLGIKQHLAVREEIMGLIYTYKDISLHMNDDHWMIEKHVMVKATMLAMAASLVLYDNFAISVMAFQNDTFLRRLANRPNKGFDIQPETLKRVLLSYHAPEKRAQVRKVLKWLQKESAWITAESKNDRELAYLQELIHASPSMHKIKKNGRVADYAKYLGLFAHDSADHFHRFSEESINELSKSFGNTAGLVELRKGKLYDKPEVAAALRKTLKPLDVLLEKTPFRLTDKFIPGHFGHVAIWLGTPAELKAMGLWEHPLVKPHQQSIQDGKQVLEALRQGVVLNSLEHFLNIDDIAILRLKQSNLEQKQGMLTRSFRQLGKAYDFNFDVETLDKIVCSELIYAVYTNVTWPTEKIAGRATISPDNVAVMALEGKPFEVVSLYHNGIDQGDARFEKYKALIEKKNTKTQK